MASTSDPTAATTADEESDIGPEHLDTSDGEAPTKEMIFEVLSNERRRYILSYLHQQEDGTVDLRELVTQVTALETETPPEQVRSDDRKSVYVGLRQTHLPKMDTYNIVEYDSDRAKIELTEAAEQAKLYLEFVPEDDIPWSYHYLGLSALMGMITALTGLGMFLFDGLSGLALAALTIVLFGISAVIHTLYTHRHRIDRTYTFEDKG